MGPVHPPPPRRCFSSVCLSTLHGSPFHPTVPASAPCPAAPSMPCPTPATLSGYWELGSMSVVLLTLLNFCSRVLRFWTKPAWVGGCHECKIGAFYLDRDETEFKSAPCSCVILDKWLQHCELNFLHLWQEIPLCKTAVRKGRSHSDSMAAFQLTW